MAETRKVLVTGASSGIGRAVCRRLLDDHHQVVGLARRASPDLFDDPGFLAAPLDLSDLKALPQALKALAKAHPDVDAVVAIAGRGQFGGLEEFAYEDIDALVALNFTSQAYLAKAFLPGLKGRGRGDLIFMGSEAALAGGRRGAVYAASKSALRGFTQSLREECAKSGVRVALINPGMVKTPFFQGLDFAPGEAPDNAIEPEDVAEVVAMILETRAGTVIDEINLSPLKKVVRFGKGD